MKRFKHLDIHRIYLQPGELYVDRQPALVQTILGSCVSITMFCPRGGFGGICHALLPSGTASDPARHVEGAVQLLLEQLLRLGARREWLEVKLFGGGKVLGEPSRPRLTVGDQNVARARTLLEELQLPLTAVDTGGLRGRRLFFNTGTGEVFVRKMHSTPAEQTSSPRSIAA